MVFVHQPVAVWLAPETPDAPGLDVDQHVFLQAGP
jgi:hypothetical protein